MCSTMNEVIQKKERKTNWVFFEDCAAIEILSKHCHDCNTTCEEVFLDRTSFSSAIKMQSTKYDTSNLQLGSIDDDLGSMKELDSHVFRKLSREDSAFSELSYGSSGFSQHCYYDRVHRSSAVTAKNEAIDELQIETKWEGSDCGSSMDPSLNQCTSSNGMVFSERSNRLDSAFSETEETQAPVYLPETQAHPDRKDMFSSYDLSVIQSPITNSVDNCGNLSTDGSHSVELDIIANGLPQTCRGITPDHARDNVSSRMSKRNTDIVKQSTMPLSMDDRSRPHTEGQFCTQMLSDNLHLVTSTNDNRPSNTVTISCVHPQSRTPFDAVPGFGEADLRRKLSGRKSKRGSDAARKTKKEVMARQIKVNTEEDIETYVGAANFGNIPFESVTPTSPGPTREGWISFDDEDVLQADMEGLNTVSKGFSGIMDHIDFQTTSIPSSRKQYADSNRSRVAQWISSEHLFTRESTSEVEIDRQHADVFEDSSVSVSELKKSHFSPQAELNGSQEPMSSTVLFNGGQQENDQSSQCLPLTPGVSTKQPNQRVNIFADGNVSNQDIGNDLFIKDNTLLTGGDMCTPHEVGVALPDLSDDICGQGAQLSPKCVDNKPETDIRYNTENANIFTQYSATPLPPGILSDGTTDTGNCFSQPAGTQGFDVTALKLEGTGNDDNQYQNFHMIRQEHETGEEVQAFPSFDDYPPAPKDKRWAFWYKDCKRGKLLRRAEWVPVTITVEGGAIVLCAVRENDNVQQEIPLLPFFAFNIPKIREVERHSKIHVAKLQYVKYKEKRKYSTKATYEHSPVFTSILKLGAKDCSYLRAFMDTVEAKIRLIPIYRDKGISYAFEEIFINSDDICHFLLSGDGDVIQYNITVRIHMLAFITGAPRLNLYLNNVESRGAGLPIKASSSLIGSTSKSVQLHMAEFHPCVDAEASADSGCLTFVPPDGCRFEVLRFRVHNDKDLPVHVKSSLDLASSNAIKITAEVKAGLLGKTGRCILHNVVMRIPMPDQWMSIFRKTRDINGKKHYMSASANPISLAPGICRGKRCAMKVSLGSVAVQPEFGAIIWRIGDLPFIHQSLPTDASHTFSCHLELPFEIQLPDDFTPFAELDFYSPYALASEVCIQDVTMGTGITPDKLIQYNSRYSYKVMLKVLNYGRAVSQEPQ